MTPFCKFTSSDLISVLSVEERQHCKTACYLMEHLEAGAAQEAIFRVEISCTGHHKPASRSQANSLGGQRKH